MALPPIVAPTFVKSKLSPSQIVAVASAFAVGGLEHPQPAQVKVPDKSVGKAAQPAGGVKLVHVEAASFTKS